MTRTFNILGLLCLLLLGAIGGAGAQVYVSLSGNDAAAGTLASPVLTLAKAQLIAQSQGSGGVTVYLRGGTYALAAPLSLTARDSGQTWAAFGGETPVISGGYLITGWTLHDAGNNIWQASVPAGMDFRQVYVNGLRAVRVRSADGSLLAGATVTSGGYTATGGAISTWGNPASIELVYRLSWMEERCPLASVSATTLTMAQPGWASLLTYPPGSSGNPAGFLYVHVGGGSPTWIENAYELLSASTPGSFYLDRTANLLYYVPRGGENMASAVVLAPQSQGLITVTGAKGITLRGLTFAESGWTLPDTANGFPHRQAGAYVAGANATPTPYAAWAKMPSAVDIAGSSACLVSSCIFTRLGADALAFDGASHDCQALGNSFFDISGGGITVGSPSDTTAVCSRILLADNTVRDIGQEYHGSAGIWLTSTDTCTVRNNLVYHVPYTGISLGWGWGDSTWAGAVNQGATVTANIVHDHMLVLQDGGGVYSNGVSAAETISRNVIYNQYQSPGAIYPDDGSFGKTLQNNVLYANSFDYHFNDNVGNCDASFNFSASTNTSYGNGGESGRVMPGFPSGTPATTVRYNQQVTASGQRPASILAAAGLETAYGGAALPLTGPTQPPALAASAVTGSSITLTWTAPSSTGTGGVTGYEVSVNGLVAGTTSGGTLTYTYPALLASTAYSFTVRARDSNGTPSPLSPALTFTSASSVPVVVGPPTFQ